MANIVSFLVQGSFHWAAGAPGDFWSCGRVAAASQEGLQELCSVPTLPACRGGTETWTQTWCSWPNVSKSHLAEPEAGPRQPAQAQRGSPLRSLAPCGPFPMSFWLLSARKHLPQSFVKDLWQRKFVFYAFPSFLSIPRNWSYLSAALESLCSVRLDTLAVSSRASNLENGSCCI